MFGNIGIPEAQPFVADDFQREALERIRTTDVLVSAPTGSGKTWIAVQAMQQILHEGRRAWYASPLKALSNSKYHEFAEVFGQDKVGVLTGDRKENTDAPIIVGTTEILRNQLYDAMAQSTDFKADLVVLDEAHYLGDRERGVVWEEVMIYLPARVRLLLLSATIRNDHEIAAWLSRIRNHPCRVVHSDRRPVPIYPLYLLPDGDLMPLSGLDGITPRIENYLKLQASPHGRRPHARVAYENILEALTRFNLLPAIFFLKSRADCNTALLACRQHRIAGARGQALRQRLEGYLDAIFSTSTVAAGVNFPARTVVLVQSDRFNGKSFVSLTATDLHQATGRAGRRGKDKIGFAVIVHGPFQDPHLIDELFSNKPEPIESQIAINFSMTLNLLLSHRPDEIHQLLNASFATFQKIDGLRELDGRREAIMLKLSRKMQGCRCGGFDEVLERAEKRQLWHQQLGRARKKLRTYARGCLKVGVSLDNDATVQQLNEKIAFLTGALATLPCDGCASFGLCHQGKNNHFLKLAEKARQITAALEDARSALWRDFCRHLDFLVLNGFADSDGRLTEDGIWASMLRLDQPLIIAELIRKRFFEELSEELMAGIIAIFVSDKFRDIDINPDMQWEKRPLLEQYYRMKAGIEELLQLKIRHGFEVPQIQFWPAVALYVWAGGSPWEDVIRLTSVDEGDLAMLVFRTADNLRQIASLEQTHPVLAGKARRTLARLLREPVVIPT